MPKLLPSRTKYRKVHKGRVRGVASRGNSVSFGEFGIQSLSRGRMTSNQIEAARVAINRHLKRNYVMLLFRESLSSEHLRALVLQFGLLDRGLSLDERDRNSIP